MLQFPRWKVLAILAVMLAGAVFALPNVLPKPRQDTVSKEFGRLSGDLPREDANNLAIALRSGSLPARLVYIDAANESVGNAPAKRSDL